MAIKIKKNYFFLTNLNLADTYLQNGDTNTNFSPKILGIYAYKQLCWYDSLKIKKMFTKSKSALSLWQVLTSEPKTVV